MGEATTVRISRSTLEMLERFKERFKAESLDETIQALIKQQRKTLLDNAFGLDKNRISPFSEDDRGENRD